MRRVLAGAALCLVGVLCAAAPNLDDPPPAYTGGFGEPTCAACHQERPEDEPGGRLRIEGLPAAYEPGRSYELTVILEHPELRSAGFELAARFAGGEAAGRQAGRLEATDERIATTTEQDGVVYAHHRREGTRFGAREARWRLRWQAPAAAAGAVVVHAAANAANDDDSPLGDRIYLALARSELRLR